MLLLNLPRERRVGALLHGLAPRLPTQGRVLSPWPCCRISRRCPLHRPIEVDADAVTHLARVLVRQHENETRGVTNRLACASGTDAETSLGLAEIDHVQGQRKVLVVRGRVTTQELGNLKGRDRDKDVSVFFTCVSSERGKSLKLTCTVGLLPPPGHPKLLLGGAAVPLDPTMAR